MSYGYSQSLVLANKQASAKSLGVALGRVCIRASISVSEIADSFGVSRMTVYNWFKGVAAPHHSYVEQIREYIRAVKQTHNLK